MHIYVSICVYFHESKTCAYKFLGCEEGEKVAEPHLTMSFAKRSFFITKVSGGLPYTGWKTATPSLPPPREAMCF